MILRPFSYVCITNNRALTRHLSSFELIDGTALDVLKKSRDLIHMGCKLILNPLYGNFKPNQQPYRSVVLSRPPAEYPKSVDKESLYYIEQALNVYQNAPLLRTPGDLPLSSDIDFMYLDYSLVEGALSQCGILTYPMKRVMGYNEGLF